MLNELAESHPSTTEAIEKKKAEFGDEIFTDLLRRLMLQMTDMLWVEHLEVMGFTRSSVNLRAYGQRDPLIEYRKEGTRLFKEMQEVVYDRIAEVLPNIQPQAIAKEEAHRKQEAEVAQETAGATAEKNTTPQEPAKNEVSHARNDVVTVTDGTQTMELKYKKAEPLLAEGWKVVQK